ncbi:MAG TPA: hypothetical protein PKZ84_21515 [Anaerolineae bacterium]|nr:hypothetical protein [Anaerolineae bacterium]HQI87528.1 hypothetical protein [Anaerolineae bacterium]
MKIICLFAAHLPVQVEQQAGAPDTAPLIVGGRPWDPGAMLDCSPDAASAGLRLGMRLARAAVGRGQAGGAPGVSSRHRHRTPVDGAGDNGGNGARSPGTDRGADLARDGGDGERVLAVEG